jgi:hypothetical protein
MNKSLFAIRVILLALAITVIYALDFVNLRLSVPLDGIVWLFGVGLLQALALSYVLMGSVWYGWKLVAALFLVYGGITVFQTQIESVVFLQYLEDIIPAQAMPSLIVNGIITAAIIALVAVILFGKMRAAPEHEAPTNPLKLSAFQWVWKLAVLGVIYMFIYFLFGLLVARPLAGAAFDEYYANLQLPIWILPFQIFRGVIWVLLTIPLIRMLRASWRATALGVSLLLAVLISSLVVPPNEFMPPAIRIAHFFELFTSMFVFGWIEVWLLTSSMQRKATRPGQTTLPRPA